MSGRGRAVDDGGCEGRARSGNPAGYHLRPGPSRHDPASSSDSNSDSGAVARYLEALSRNADPVEVKPPEAPPSVGKKPRQEGAETDFDSQPD